MIRVLCVVSLLGLAACGVDGEPVQPHGGVNIGVGSNGAHAGGTVGVSRGPLSVGVSLF